MVERKSKDSTNVCGNEKHVFLKQKKISIPIVAVLRGTNSSEAKLILEESQLDITFAEDLPDAAMKINEKMGGK